MAEHQGRLRPGRTLRKHIVESSGTLLYREGPDGLEVLLVHPSGNYNHGKPGASPRASRTKRNRIWKRPTSRNFGGDRSDSGDAPPLGHADYRKSGKRIHCFAGPAPADAAPRTASWEVDQASFVSLAKARQLLHPDQQIFLDRLVEQPRR